MKNRIPLLFFILLIAFLTCVNSITFAETLPRFMLMIDEINTGNSSTGDSERILSQSLIEKGAEVIDRELIQTSIDRNKAVQALSGNPQAAASIGLQVGADIMLIGKAIVQHSGNVLKNTDFKSYQATINIKAIKTDTAEVIYTGTGSAAKIHVNDIIGGSLALQAAAQQLSTNFVPKLLEKQKTNNNSSRMSKIQLIVGNISEFWQVGEVKKMLRSNVSGVQDVVQRSFVAGSAIFEIHYGGSSEQFADTLSTAKADDFRLKIQGLSSNKLDTVFVDKNKQSLSVASSLQQPKETEQRSVTSKQKGTSQNPSPPPKQQVAAITTEKTTSNLPQTKKTKTLVASPEVSETEIPQLSKDKTTLPPNINPKNIEFGNYHALFIGNSKYEGIESLNTPKSDVKAIAEILSSKYGFETQFLYDASRYEMLSKLNDLRSTLGKKDNLLIYYAGHGYLDEDTNEGYWLPIDSEKDNPANWLSNNTITNILKSMEAKHVMIVSDSCYSGTLSRSIQVKLRKPSYIQRMAQNRARTVLASGGLEPVLDAGGDENHSIFATAFINALKENNYPYIATTHLFAQIKRAVVVNSDQTPEYSDIRKAGHKGGDFIFIKSY